MSDTFKFCQGRWSAKRICSTGAAFLTPFHSPLPLPQTSPSSLAQALSQSTSLQELFSDLALHRALNIRFPSPFFQNCLNAADIFLTTPANVTLAP
jgi:hypothetical protein